MTHSIPVRETERSVKRMTDKELWEINNRCAAVTPGPWYVSGDIKHLVFSKSVRNQNTLGMIADCRQLHNADTKEHVLEMQKIADFIARARQDIPTLLNEIESLQAENTRLKALLPRWIPITERLPEGTVIGCDKWGNVQPAMYIKPLKKWEIMPNACVTMEVTHWMPLPTAEGLE